MPPFERAEYDARLVTTRKRMAAQGLAALIVTDPANIYYLTGYDAWSFYTPQGLYVPADGELLLFAREMDANGAHATSWLPRGQVLGYPESYVQQPDRHPMDWVAGVLAERAGLRADLDGPVGLECDAYYFSARAADALRAALPGIRFTDAGPLVNWVRAVKSPAEIDLMRRAARIADQVMGVAVEAVRPGRRQCDAAAEIAAAQAAGTAEFGGDYPAIVPMLPSGGSSGIPHLTWSDRPFAAGDATVVEIAGVHRRYHAPLARTIMLGTPPKRLVETSLIVQEGMLAALDAARPGATCEAVERAWRDVIARHGLEKPSRIGYSIGVGYPPDWGEHTMSLRPGDATVLAPNMTFHLILGMWMDGWGLELSETVTVTDDGAECLCSVSRELFTKEAN
ncbi:MAG TPA: M24 family metallopeptidase [Streptosporangiaceae bacterium]